jgi:hypothetical protein
MRSFSACLLGCLSLLTSSGVTAAATTINFDELPVSSVTGGPFNGDTYLSRGVRFRTSGAGLFLSGTRTLADTDSPPNTIYGSTNTAGSNADAQVIAEFVEVDTTRPTSVGTVAFTVADASSDSSRGQWSAEIFDINGTSLASQTGTAPVARLTFPRTQADVARLVFTPSTDLELFDTLTFEVPEPACPSLLAVAAALVLRRRRRV